MSMQVDQMTVTPSLDQKTPGKIDKKYVHKAFEHNVVIGDIVKRTDLGNDLFDCPMIIDQTLPFFFEHYIDHVPDLFLIEAVRQMGTAVCHLHYGVEFDFSFVLDFINIRFTSFTELQQPVSMRMFVEEGAENQFSLNKKNFMCKTSVIQDGQTTTEIQSFWRCIRKTVMHKLRNRKLLPLTQIS